MQSSPSKVERVEQAVFSVCVPDDMMSGIIETVNDVPGARFMGQFQEYITADKRPQFPDVMKEAQVCVALVGCDLNPDLALKTMERLTQTFPHNLRLIIVASKIDPGFLVHAMRSGCNDIVNLPVDHQILMTALDRFKKQSLAQALSARGSGKVIALYGVKGGVGTTTMAVHLAIHLVRTHRKKVLLIDHKHELGHVALHLGIKPSVYHFDELLRNVDRLDSDLIAGFVTRHNGGLDVIPSPDSCGPLPEVSPDAIARVMEDLRTRYDFILLDSSLQYVSQLPALIAACDEVALVCTPDVVALRDMVRHIEHLSLINGFTNKVRIVINRSGSDHAVSSDEIQAAVRLPISVTVPNNYAELMKSINAGEPIQPQQKGTFTQVFGQWALRLTSDPSLKVGPGDIESKKRSFFRF